MKPIWVLLLVSTPLGALTTWSFVEIGDDKPAESVQAKVDLPEAAAAARAASTRARTERQLAGRLTAADLLVPERVPELQAAPKTSLVEPLAAPWAQWIGLRLLVDDYLRVEQSVKDGELPELKQAVTALEQIQQKAQAASLRSERDFAGLLSARIATFKAEVTRRETEAEADLAMAKIVAAFKATDYPLGLRLADDWLGKFTSPALERKRKDVRRLRQRIEFHQDCAKTQEAYGQESDYQPKIRVLQAFVDKYNGADLEPAELKIVAKCQKTIDELSYYAQQETALAEFSGDLDDLVKSPGSDLEQRLGGIQGLLEKHRARTAQYGAATKCRGAARTAVKKWLAEALPEKQIDEPEGVEEAQTKSGQLVRGFFKAVKMPNQKPGYKCYPTAAQRANPTGNVGTYPLEDLLGPPGPSIPRRAVTKYNEARALLLAAPEQKQAWESLGRICRENETDLAEYRQKRKDASDLAFAKEAELAEQIASGPRWQVIEQLWSP